MTLSDRQEAAIQSLGQLRTIVSRIQALRKFQIEYGVIHAVANALAEDRKWNCQLTWEFLMFLGKIEAVKLLYRKGEFDNPKLLELVEQLEHCAAKIRASTDIEVIVLQ